MVRAQETMPEFGHDDENSMNALQLFEPDARAVYTIEMVAQLAEVPRRLIVLYCKLGLVSPVRDPASCGWCFSDEAIRIVRRIEYLRSACGVNLAGIKLILGLMDEVERLREELRFQHRR
jgi:DNA-binding transcriptional MerR regulator